MRSTGCPPLNRISCDELNHRIQKFDRSGRFLAQLGGIGTAPGQFSEPWSVLVTASGNLWVSDVGNGRIQVFGTTRNEPPSHGNKVLYR